MVPGPPQLSRPISSKICATESPTAGVGAHQLSYPGNFERRTFDYFRHRADILATDGFQRVFHHAGSADAHADYGFRFCYAMKGAGHKGIIVYRVTEHHQLRAADGVVGRRFFRSFFHHAAHLRHRVHIDAGLGGTDVDRRADHVSCGQRFRNGSDQVPVAFGIAFVHQRAEAADKVYPHFMGCFVQRFGQGHIIIGIAAFAYHGNRCYGNTFIDNRHAQVGFNIFPGLHQLFCFFRNFVIDFIRADFHIRMPAVPEADAHGDGTHIQVVVRDHLRGFQHIIKS